MTRARGDEEMLEEEVEEEEALDLGKTHGTISAVQMDFVQIAFQPPRPQATGPFGATFFAEN